MTDQGVLIRQLQAVEPWHAPTLAGTWVNLGGSVAVAGYRKDIQGRVFLRGAVRNGGANQVMILPAEYSPLATVKRAGVALVGTTRYVVEIEITAAGVVNVFSPAPNFATGAADYYTIGCDFFVS